MANAYYDPGTQRWLNRDPMEELGGINLYEFTENNPVSGFDPYGLKNTSGGDDWVYDPGTGQFVQVPGSGTIGPGNKPPIALPNSSPCKPPQTQTRQEAIPCDDCEKTGEFKTCTISESCQIVATVTGGTGSASKPTPRYDWKETGRVCGECATMIP